MNLMVIAGNIGLVVGLILVTLSVTAFEPERGKNVLGCGLLVWMISGLFFSAGSWWV